MSSESIAKESLWPAYQKFARVKEEFDTSSWRKELLIGPGSRLDSIHFVQFLIEIENQLGLSKKIFTSAIDPKALDTLGAFSDHVFSLLKEKHAL